MVPFGSTDGRPESIVVAACPRVSAGRGHSAGQDPAPTLLDKTLRADEKEEPVEEIVEAFLKYPNLPSVEGAHVVWDAIVQGVSGGLFGLRSGNRVYFKEPVPAQKLEYGAVLVREPAVLQTPSPSPTIMPGRVAADEILSVLGAASEAAAKDLYRNLWIQRSKDFKDEAEFRVAFDAAIKDGIERKLFVCDVPAAAEKLDWAELLEGAKIKRRTTAAQPSTVQTYTLQVQVPWDKLSDFVRGVVKPLRDDSAELTVEVHLQARSVPGGFKKTTLEQKVRETLNQIGAKVITEHQGPA